MKNEIVNRVAKSPLITLDLSEYYPPIKKKELDISSWLYSGLVLKEKEFRQAIKEHNWSQYEDEYLAIHCSTEAIVPDWAYLLIGISLTPYTTKFVYGDSNKLDEFIFHQIIDELDWETFTDKPVIIKGCSHPKVSVNTYLQIAIKLKPFAKSIMFGEACSTVPLYKKK